MASLTPPLLPPIYLPGQEPMPQGTTPQEREEFRQMMKWQGWMTGAMESCPLKVVMSGGAGQSDRGLSDSTGLGWKTRP